MGKIINMAGNRAARFILLDSQIVGIGEFVSLRCRKDLKIKHNPARFSICTILPDFLQESKYFMRLYLSYGDKIGMLHFLHIRKYNFCVKMNKVFLIFLCRNNQLMLVVLPGVRN